MVEETGLQMRTAAMEAEAVARLMFVHHRRTSLQELLLLVAEAGEDVVIRDLTAVLWSLVMAVPETVPLALVATVKVVRITQVVEEAMLEAGEERIAMGEEEARAIIEVS